MADSPNDRLYDEEEIRSILRRATELQQASGSIQSGSKGLTIKEVEQIASEIGIDPAFIRAALETSYDTGEQQKFLGVPMMNRISAEIGGELTDEKWQRIVSVMRSSFGGVGKTGEVGKAREWSSLGEIASISVSPHRKGIKAQVEARYNYQVAFALFLTTVWSLMGSGAFIESVHLPIAAEIGIAFGGFAGIIAGVRTGIIMIISRHRRKLRQIMDQVRLILENVPAEHQMHSVSDPAAEILSIPQETDQETQHRLKKRLRTN